MVGRFRSVEVGKAGEEKVRRKVRELKVLVVVAARDVATIGIWTKGGVGAGKEEDEILGGDKDDEVPGEQHHAVDHHWNPQYQVGGDLPGTKLTQLHKAFIIVHDWQHSGTNAILYFLTIITSISGNSRLRFLSCLF